MVKNIYNNLFMLCKFTTDAIQLFFFVFLSQIYKKIGC